MFTKLARGDVVVDAAAGAIVSWGRDQKQRQRAVQNLQTLLRQAKDLDPFVNRFHRECIDSGVEKPIIRKAIGRVLSEKEQFTQAIPHLEASVESGPFDSETHRLLIAAYEKSGNVTVADIRSAMRKWPNCCATWIAAHHW